MQLFQYADGCAIQKVRMNAIIEKGFQFGIKWRRYDRKVRMNSLREFLQLLSFFKKSTGEGDYADDRTAVQVLSTVSLTKSDLTNTCHSA